MTIGGATAEHRTEPRARQRSVLCLPAHDWEWYEWAIRCRDAGTRIALPPRDGKEALLVDCSEKFAAPLQHYGAIWYETRDALRAAVDAGLIDAVVVATPKQLEAARAFLGPLPMIVTHAVNRFDQYREIGITNFISPSRRALMRVGAPNQLLSVRVRDLARLRKQVKPLRVPLPRRSGFFSYIHRYARSWPRAHELFSTIADDLTPGIDVRNFGIDNPAGRVHDFEYMLRSRATIHVKDDGVSCTAVINSISVGTPVLMDTETLDRLQLEDYVVHMVSGVVFDTAEQGAEWIRRLHRDNALLRQLVQRTRSFARLKLRHTELDVERFREFMEKAHRSR